MGDVVIGATELRKQLVAAEEAQKTAETAVETAQMSFDEDGSDSAGKALLKARDALALKAEHVARARRLLDEAEAREAEAERQKKLARAAELSKALEPLELRAAVAPLVAQEVEALKVVARIRAERRAMAAAKRALWAEMLRIHQELGQKPDLSDSSEAYVLEVEPVKQALEKAAREAGWEGDLGRMLRMLLPERETYYGPPLHRGWVG